MVLAFFNGIILLLLAVIFIQDMKYRAVSWILFPLQATVLSGYTLLKTSIEDFLFNSAVNFLLLLIVFTLVYLYFSIKTKSLVNITKELIGWGDILFLLCIAVLFSPMNFMLFIIVSLFIIAIGAGIYIAVNNGMQVQIPLAGLQAILVIALMVTSLLYPKVQLHSDEWLLLIL